MLAGNGGGDTSASAGVSAPPGGVERGAAPLSSYRHLARRVIYQAVRDLARPGGSPADRVSARAFLAGSTMFDHWCAVAEMDPRRIRTWLAGYAHAHPQPSATNDVLRSRA